MFRSGPVDVTSCSLRKRRIELLGKVERLADTLDLSGQEPGHLGESRQVDEWFNDDTQDVAYTCENAQHFFLHHVQYRWEDFHRKLKIAGKKGENIHKAHGGTQGDLSDAVCMYEKCHKLDLSFVACRGMLPAFRSWPKPAQQTKSAEWMEKAPRRAKHYNFSLNKQRMQVHIRITNDTDYICVYIYYIWIYIIYIVDLI